MPGSQGVIGVLALYVTVLILTTQRCDDQLAGYREQLTLELAWSWRSWAATSSLCPCS